MQSGPLSSTFYMNSAVVDPSTITTAFKTPEEQITGFEKDFLGRVSYLPLNQQSLYRSQINSFVRDLRSQLIQIRGLIYDTWQIQTEISKAIVQYSRSLEDLYAHNFQYNVGKTQVEEQNKAVAEEIRGVSIHFTPFVPKRGESPVSSLRRNLAQNLTKIDMQDHLLDVSIVANLVRATGDVVLESAKAVCKATETTEKVCRSTLDFAGKAGKAVLEFTHTKELVKDAIRYWQSCEGSNLAEILVERYGFSSEEAKKIAKQYVKDVGAIATTAGTVCTIGTTSLVVKVVKRLLKSAPTVEATLPATIEIASTDVQFSAPLRPIKPLLLSDTKELTAMRINGYASKRIYFPDVAQIKEVNLRDLHQIWTRNQETLVGLIGEAAIPNFGFHGTGPKGMYGILTSQTSLSKGGPYIWVAGYRYSVPPTAQLADLHSLAKKALGYVQQGGGVFVVETSEAIPYGQSIKAIDPERLALDTLKQRRFFNLMEREADGLSIIAKNGKAAVSEEALLNAGEYHLQFTPDNFNPIVRGVLLNKDTLYPAKKMLDLAASAEKDILANRFRIQEIIMGAFEKLIVCEEFSNLQWEFYQKAGRKILNLPKSKLAVPLRDLIRIEKEFNQADAAGKRFFSLHQKAIALENDLTSPSFPSFTDRWMGNVKFKGLGDLKIGGWSSLHSKEMVIALEFISNKKTALNSKQLLNQLKRYAKANGAETLYIELDFSNKAIETGFKEELQRYPEVLRRANIINLESEDVTSYVFQISLH